MDNMSLFDAIAVGTPELSLMLLTGIVSIKGNVFKAKSFDLKDIAKLLIVSIIFPLSLIIIRRNVHNFIIICLISLIVNILILKIIFQFNFRQALIGGYLAMFTLIFAETFSTPIISLLRIKYTGYYFNYRFIFSLPTRILQIMILFICLRFNLKSNKLLNLEWNLLSKSKKTTFYITSLLLVSGYLFSANYTEIFFKINLYNIDVEKIFFNIQIFFIETIVFMIVTVILINRTILYEDYRYALNRPKKTFQKLLYNSTEKEIYYYLDIVKNYLEVIKIESIEKKLEEMKTASRSFYYNIDKKLWSIDYNFKKIYFMLEMFSNNVIKEINFESMAVDLELRDGIFFSLKIILNDIEKKKLLKILKKDLDMEDIKLSLFNENAEYRTAKEKYFEMDIQIPYENIEEDMKI